MGALLCASFRTLFKEDLPRPKKPAAAKRFGSSIGRRKWINRVSPKQVDRNDHLREIKAELIEVRGNCCQFEDCRCAKWLEVHHVLPRKQGGDDLPENLLLLCEMHHRYVHANPKWSYANGYLRHSWDAGYLVKAEKRIGGQA